MRFKSIINSPFILKAYSDGGSIESYTYHDLFDFMHTVEGKGEGVPGLEDSIQGVYTPEGNRVFDRLTQYTELNKVKDLMSYAKSLWYILHYKEWFDTKRR